MRKDNLSSISSSKKKKKAKNQGENVKFAGFEFIRMKLKPFVC